MLAAKSPHTHTPAHFENRKYYQGCVWSSAVVFLWACGAFLKSIRGAGWGLITSSHLGKIIYHFMPLEKKKCWFMFVNLEPVKLSRWRVERMKVRTFVFLHQILCTWLSVRWYPIISWCTPVSMFVFTCGVCFSWLIFTRMCKVPFSLPRRRIQPMYAGVYLCIMNCVKFIYSLLCKHVVLDPWIMWYL